MTPLLDTTKTIIGQEIIFFSEKKEWSEKEGNTFSQQPYIGQYFNLKYKQIFEVIDTFIEPRAEHLEIEKNIFYICYSPEKNDFFDEALYDSLILNTELPEEELKRFEQEKGIHLKLKLKNTEELNNILTTTAPYIEYKHTLNVVIENTFPEENNTSVFCFTLNNENQLLVFSHSTDNLRELDIPGGHIEKNEGIIQALEREVLEETGYTIKNIKYVGTKYFELNCEKPLNYKYPFPKSNMLFFCAFIDTKITDNLAHDSKKTFFIDIEEAIKILPLETTFLLKEVKNLFNI